MVPVKPGYSDRLYAGLVRLPPFDFRRVRTLDRGGGWPEEEILTALGLLLTR
jgi:hypothetical protein